MQSMFVGTIGAIIFLNILLVPLMHSTGDIGNIYVLDSILERWHLLEDLDGKFEILILDQPHRDYGNTYGRA